MSVTVRNKKTSHVTFTYLMYKDVFFCVIPVHQNRTTKQEKQNYLTEISIKTGFR